MYPTVRTRQGLVCTCLAQHSWEACSIHKQPCAAQVNRLELTLSIGSFSAALGAMVAGIFGMNLKSTLEDSIIGFWGTTAGIVLCCFWVFYALYSYTRRRRIL